MKALRPSHGVQRVLDRARDPREAGDGISDPFPLGHGPLDDPSQYADPAQRCPPQTLNRRFPDPRDRCPYLGRNAQPLRSAIPSTLQPGRQGVLVLSHLCHPACGDVAMSVVRVEGARVWDSGRYHVQVPGHQGQTLVDLMFVPWTSWEALPAIFHPSTRISPTVGSQTSYRELFRKTPYSSQDLPLANDVPEQGGQQLPYGFQLPCGHGPCPVPTLASSSCPLLP